MTTPAILRQREVEQLLQDQFHLRYREAIAIVAADVIPRTAVDGCTHRRWLRVDVLAFDVTGYLRKTAGRQGPMQTTRPGANPAATPSCP